MDWEGIKIKMETIKRNKNIIMSGVMAAIVIFLMLAASGMIWPELPKYGTFTENRNDEQFIRDMWTGTVIEQEFVCTADCEFITLEFSHHDTYISGKTHFLIKQKSDGAIVNNTEIDNGNIRYLEPVKLYLEGNGKAGRTYILTISVIEAPENTALGIYGYLPDEGEPVCTVNGEKSEYAVGIGTHASTYSYRIHFLLVFGTLILMLLLCILFTEIKKAKPESLFLCIAIPMGIIFISFLNVNIVHDGGTHLTNVYKYSNILLGKGEQDSGGYVCLSQDELELRKETDNFYVLLGRIGYKDRNNEEWQLYYDERPTANDSILEYFPGTFGITLGRVLNLGAMSSLLLAKLCCLTFYVAVCYFAIRKTPFLKEGFAAAALLPMNLYQAAGITYDAVATPVAYYALAVILKGREKKLGKREWICFLLAGIILGSCKGGIYIPVLLLLVFISSELNGGRKIKIRACLSSWLLAGGALLYVYRTAFSNFFYQYNPAEQAGQIADTAEEISWAVSVQSKIPKYSLGYLFSNPIGFMKMFLRTMFEETENYLGSMVGNRMAWTDEQCDWTIIILFLVLLVLAAAWKEKEQIKEIRLAERVFVGMLLLGELIGLHALMLVETRLGQDVIFGVQGRYFLPLIPLAMFCLHNKSRIRMEQAENREWRMLTVLQIMYIFDFITIVYGIK